MTHLASDDPAQEADGTSAEEADYSLVLYVSGASTSSARAIRQVQALCEQQLPGRYELTVVDVRQDGERANERRVLATPTLVRESPPPERRRVGDFSDHALVLAALRITATSEG